MNRPFELVMENGDGWTEFWRDQKELPLRHKAVERILQVDIKSVDIHPLPAKDQQHPSGLRAGPNKAATLRTWEEARAYCQSVYPGGDLPTERQWEKACGGNEYCTASGALGEAEADYGKSYSEGPAAVYAFPANPNGVKGMTGGVWEWTLGHDSDGNRIARGGCWMTSATYFTNGHGNRAYVQSAPYPDVGFRCVAPPQDPKK